MSAANIAITAKKAPEARLRENVRAADIAIIAETRTGPCVCTVGADLSFDAAKGSSQKSGFPAGLPRHRFQGSHREAKR